MSQSWQTPFRLLRDQFLAASRKSFRIHLALASFPNHEAYNSWYQHTIEADLLREATSLLNRERDDGTRVSACGFAWGQAEGAQRFDVLAREAGHLLPSELHPPSRLFPWFDELGNLNPDPTTLWSEFLFVSRSASFRVSEGWPVPGCRVARLNGDPFLISATAIEQFLLPPDAPDANAFALLMRRACPWLANNAGGFPVTPPGFITSPFIRLDLPGVFRCAVELGSALAARDAAAAAGESQDEGGGDRFKLTLDAGRTADAATDRLLCVLNPRLSSVPEWSRLLDLADASPAARQALRTLGLAVADIRGDWEERGRELLSGGAWHLWAGMRAEDRAEVAGELVETHRVWGWPGDPCGEPGAYAGPQATLSDPRVIDQNRWRTTRADYLNQLQEVASRHNHLVDTIQLPGGEYFDIYRDDVKGTRYSIPSVCPHAEPKPPLDLRPEGDLLAELEGRFHDLGLIGPDESIHWVGRQTRRETRCRCELAPARFYQPRPAEWATLRDLKAAIVAMTKLVGPYVGGRRAGTVFPIQEQAPFVAAAERVYGLAQSLDLPLPPSVVVNPTAVRVRPYGLTALPVSDLAGELVIPEPDGRQWLSSWRAVRIGIDARLAQLDRLAEPGVEADGVDTRDHPLDAPAGTPPPLREAFESVARALCEAAEFRREPWSGSVAFGELARNFAACVQAADRRYAEAELELQAAADAEGCAHREALAAIRRVNDAVGHVMLGAVPDHEAVAHLRDVPTPDEVGLLRRMRQQVSRAARARTLASHSSNGSAVRQTRIRCEESDRSVCLDGKRIAGELEVPIFGFFKAIVEAYPNPISYRQISQITPGLRGKHPTRDLKDRLPPALANLVQSGKPGYVLKLPAPK